MMTRSKRLETLRLMEEAVGLYFLKGLETLIYEDLWNYMDNIDSSLWKKQKVRIVGETNSDCLNIYLALPEEKEEQYEQREIAHIHSEDVLHVYKKYNNKSRTYKKRLKGYIEQLKKDGLIK